MKRLRYKMKYSYSLVRIVVLFFGISSFLLFMACQSDRKQVADDENLQSGSPAVDEALVATGLPASMQIPFFYNYVPDSNTFEMEQNEYYNREYLHIDTLVKAFNVYYPDVRLVYEKSSSDTVFVRIDDAMYLTQQMGSEGAAAYISEVVYGLTELPGIEVVNFHFKEGDHAVPGPYDRDRITKRVNIH